MGVSHWQQLPSGYCSATLCELAPMQGQSDGCAGDATCFDPDPNTADDQYCVLDCVDTVDCPAGGYTCQNNGCLLP